MQAFLKNSAIRKSSALTPKTTTLNIHQAMTLHLMDKTL
jgi:hypothetical protein